MRLGIADHLGWAAAVTTTADHQVVDRRRIALVEPGVPNMPIHHDSKTLDVAATEALVARVRDSAKRATEAALDALAASLPAPIWSVAIRRWPADFPTEVAIQRVSPHEAWADGVMYRQVLAEVARARGWEVRLYDAKTVEAQDIAALGERADAVLRGPRARLGPPLGKDQRVALAATVVA